MIDMTRITGGFEQNIQKTCSLLVFRLDEQLFALDNEYVAQIIPMLRLTPVPQVDYMIEGVANIHGTAVPVISARRYLGLPDVQLGMFTPIILAEVMERQIGIIVDEVTDVISVQVGTIIAPGDILPEDMVPPPVLSGLVYQQDHSILMLDPRYLLRSSQFRTINRSISANAHSVLVNHPQGANKRKGLQQPITPDRVAFETVRAALDRKLNEIRLGNQNPGPKSSPSVNATSDNDLEIDI